MSGKILFWPFWTIFGQNYIACGDKLRFLTIFDQFLQVCWCLFDIFCFLNQVYGLRRDKVSLGFDKKMVIFLPFWSKICPFMLKNQVFGCFLENRLSEFQVTWSETRDNCFQSFNGSVVSGKIVFWPFWPIFCQKYIACGDKLRFLTIFDRFLPVCWCLFANFFFLNQVYGLTRDKVSLGCDKKNY